MPAPLTASDCDLAGLRSMMFDVGRILDSDLFGLTTGDEFKAAFALWCKAWTQVPAGSLPADERLLAKWVGVSLSEWRTLAEMSMRGWVLCDDGRYYHPVVAEAVLIAWAAKKRRMAKKNRRLEIESGEWDAMRKAVFARDDFTCLYCGVRGARLECDHVVPVAAGGPTEISNLVTSCRPCNRAKGTKSLAVWRPECGGPAQ